MLIAFANRVVQYHCNLSYHRLLHQCLPLGNQPTVSFRVNLGYSGGQENLLGR
jgi:hypothetical protein